MRHIFKNFTKVVMGCIAINFYMVLFCFSKQFIVYDITKFKAAHIAVKLVSNIHFHAR